MYNIPVCANHPKPNAVTPATVISTFLEDEGNKTIGDNHNRKELLESSMTEDVSPEAKSRRAQKPEPSARSMTSPHCQRFDILQSPEPYQESPKVRGRTVTSE